MAEVSFKKGFTYRVGPLDQMQFARIDIEVSKLDTNLPIAPQLEGDTENVLIEVSKFVDKHIDAEINKVLDENPEGEKK
tara:strand:+ start:11125 stop:11361 length:237 start_codon:yes stop_codon:yes gene_type:complete